MTVPRILSHTPKENADTSWVECHPQTVGNFSAVAYFFGRALHQELDIPIGLINTSWGGTAAEAWTSRKTLETTPECLPILERAYAPEDANGPSVLYNGMIAPLLPYAIRGAIWYQGESNVGRASQYRTLFPAMIQDWRQSWGQGDFPFLFVQLANFWERQTVPSESDWGELREAQLMTLALPNTGMAVAIDLGEAEDIHPKNKQDVGLRLALAALATVYGREIPHSGPIYERMEIEGSRIRLHFRHTNGGLMVKGSETLEGFAIAGESRRFVWAEARIDDDTVLVSSAQVTEPVAVRYGWHHNPLCNLYNRTGLPASPFRTDDWPGVTVNNR
jgi:sialate O-acetylesterase